MCFGRGFCFGSLGPVRQVLRHEVQGRECAVSLMLGDTNSSSPDVSSGRLGRSLSEPERFQAKHNNTQLKRVATEIVFLSRSDAPHRMPPR